MSYETVGLSVENHKILVLSQDNTLENCKAIYKIETDYTINHTDFQNLKYHIIFEKNDPGFVKLKNHNWYLHSFYKTDRIVTTLYQRIPGLYEQEFPHKIYQIDDIEDITHELISEVTEYKSKKKICKKIIHNIQQEIGKNRRFINNNITSNIENTYKINIDDIQRCIDEYRNTISLLEDLKKNL